MCKHVAAVLYAIGARFDQQPELLFRLHKVNEEELIAKVGKELSLARQGPATAKLLGNEDLADIFGLDMAQSTGTGLPGVRKTTARSAQKSKSRKAAVTTGTE
jgi:uncharacterized Zn finger protein